MKKNTLGTSLIEIIIATTILSITIFGVYKLIAENFKIIDKDKALTEKNLLIKNIIECIKEVGFDTFIASPVQNYSFNFGPLGVQCNTGSYDTNYSFTPINLNKKEYFLYGNITNSGSDFIDWNLGIFEEESGKIEQSYLQIK